MRRAHISHSCASIETGSASCEFGRGGVEHDLLKPVINVDFPFLRIAEAQGGWRICSDYRDSPLV